MEASTIDGTAGWKLLNFDVVCHGVENATQAAADLKEKLLPIYVAGCLSFFCDESTKVCGTTVRHGGDGSSEEIEVPGWQEEDGVVSCLVSQILSALHQRYVQIQKTLTLELNVLLEGAKKASLILHMEPTWALA